jgi:putative transposase
LKPGRLFSPPGTYFVTFSTFHRRKLFVVEITYAFSCKHSIGIVAKAATNLHAFVVMPEHVHLLLTPAPDVTIERTVQLIKGAYSHELGTIIGRDPKSGSADSPTIEFATRLISP